VAIKPNRQSFGHHRRCVVESHTKSLSRFGTVGLNQGAAIVVFPIAATSRIHYDGYASFLSSAQQRSQQPMCTNSLAVIGNEQHIAKRNGRKEPIHVYVHRCGHFAIASVRPKLTTDNDSLFPRGWAVIGPDVLFDAMVVK
jgi:hypothetical protein